MMSGLLLGKILSVCTCWFCSTVTWTSRNLYQFCAWSYQWSLSNFTLIFLYVKAQIIVSHYVVFFGNLTLMICGMFYSSIQLLT